MNLRLFARRVPATRAFSTSRACNSGKSSMTEVSDGGSANDKVQAPVSLKHPDPVCDSSSMPAIIHQA